MKIIKAYKSKDNHLYLCVNKIPKIKYEKINHDYVGSDKKGYFSRWLKREDFGNAFGGRELNLIMKDDSNIKIKDYWFDQGHYPNHGEFVSVGMKTMNDLQNCYVYTSYNISKDKLNELITEYLSRERFYEYYEIEKWLKLQYKWYPVIFHGRELPFMINKNGDIVDKYTKEPKYCMWNICKTKVPKKYHLKTFRYFKIKYMENGRLIKLESKYSKICRDSLPKKYYKELQEKYKNDIW